MKFTAALVALAFVGSASAASCSASQFAGSLNADELLMSASIFCGGSSPDQDIDLISGRDGFAMRYTGDLNVKLFASGNAYKSPNCKRAFEQIFHDCTQKSLKYGRMVSGSDYFSITVLPGNTNDIFL